MTVIIYEAFTVTAHVHRGWRKKQSLKRYIAYLHGCYPHEKAPLRDNSEQFQHPKSPPAPDLMCLSFCVLSLNHVHAFHAWQVFFLTSTKGV